MQVRERKFYKKILAFVSFAIFRYTHTRLHGVIFYAVTRVKYEDSSLERWHSSGNSLPRGVSSKTAKQGINEK